MFNVSLAETVFLGIFPPWTAIQAELNFHFYSRSRREPEPGDIAAWIIEGEDDGYTSYLAVNQSGPQWLTLFKQEHKWNCDS